MIFRRPVARHQHELRSSGERLHGIALAATPSLASPCAAAVGADAAWSDPVGLTGLAGLVEPRPLDLVHLSISLSHLIFFPRPTLPDALAILNQNRLAHHRHRKTSVASRRRVANPPPRPFHREETYSRTIDLFSNSHFYVHAAALALVAIALHVYSADAPARPSSTQGSK